jgi:hypothetical protein
VPSFYDSIGRFQELLAVGGLFVFQEQCDAMVISRHFKLNQEKKYFGSSWRQQLTLSGQRTDPYCLDTLNYYKDKGRDA